MKKIKLLNIIGITFMFGLFLTSCKKDEDTSQQEVTFTISNPGSMLKSTSNKNLELAKKILLTIATSDGKPTSYTSSEVELLQMNGEYFSQKILLKAGSYKLTEFLLLDANNNIVFAVPLAGSQEAQNVGQPLPIVFNVSKNLSTPIKLEVMSTESKTIEAFGYTRFYLTENKGFKFQASVIDHLTGDFISANLNIYMNNYDFRSEFMLIDSATNYFSIDTTLSYNNLNLICFKEGYKPKSFHCTWDSLSLYKDTPMVIKLESNNLITDKVSDVEGNVYKTVRIGEQWWMAENLVTTKYANGTPIHLITEQDIYSWTDTIEEEGYYEKGFYTWKAAMKGRKSSSYNPSQVQGVCPDGWHLPSYTEWDQLVAYLSSHGYGYQGSGSDIGKALASTSYWKYPFNNISGSPSFIPELNNSSGFEGLPLSYFYNSSHNDMGYQAFWWTATTSPKVTSHCALLRALYFDSDKLNNLEALKNYGLNVRCVKD
jgi:uncharacterized protein (TIGR02145 family)